MTKTEIKKDIISRFGAISYLNIKQIAEYLGAGRNYPKQLMAGCRCLPHSGRERLYFVDDVAQKIIERSVMS